MHADSAVTILAPKEVGFWQKAQKINILPITSKPLHRTDKSTMKSSQQIDEVF